MVLELLKKFTSKYHHSLFTTSRWFCGFQTCVIVNTIAENLNLKQGAVSKALLSAAGSGLQSAVRTAGGRAVQFGDVVVTNGFKLSCKKVFHAICPFWDTGAAKAENVSVLFKV